MGKNKDEIRNILSSLFKEVNDWFYENFMILNSEKRRFMCLGKNIDDTENLNFNDLILKDSKEVENLRITLDRTMGFNNHIKNICRPETKCSI